MEKKGIVAFAFGTPEHIASNQIIGRIASFTAIDADAPIYTQRDVPIYQSIPTTYTEEEPGNPPPTLRIARGAVKWAIAQGITELWIAAAEPHLRRCMRDMHEAVIEYGGTVALHACPEIARCAPYVWFCKDSTQTRTRTKGSWLKRELILMAMPFAIYKRVAH